MIKRESTCCARPLALWWYTSIGHFLQILYSFTKADKTTPRQIEIWFDLHLHYLHEDCLLRVLEINRVRWGNNFGYCIDELHLVYGSVGSGFNGHCELQTEVQSSSPWAERTLRMNEHTSRKQTSMYSWSAWLHWHNVIHYFVQFGVVTDQLYLKCRAPFSGREMSGYHRLCSFCHFCCWCITCCLHRY